MIEVDKPVTTELAKSSQKPSFGMKIMVGVGWNLTQLLAAQGTSFIVKLILARLLLPEHFGIVGMAVVFIGFFNAIGDLGLGAALIQFRQDRLQKIHLDTVFWISLFFNGILFLVIALAIAPFAAWFYDEPLLRLVIPVMGISVFLSPLSLVHRILLTRALRFKPLSLIAVTAAVVSGFFAIILALAGAGVWSIVFQSVLSALISLPLLWYATKWQPRLRYSKQAAKDVLGFGIYDALQRTSVYFSKNFDYLLVGKLLGAELLGIYTFAFLLTDTFRQQIMNALSKVMFPIYGRLQDDLVSIKRYYLEVIKFNTIFIMPFVVIFITLTQPLIYLLFGERWADSIFPIQAMAIASLIHAIGGTTDSVLKGIGRFDLNLKIFFLTTIIVDIPAYTVGTYFYGVNGIAVAIIISKFSSRVVYQYHIRKLINVSEVDIFHAVKLVILVGGTSTLLLFGLTSYIDIDTYFLLFLIVGLYFTFYFCVIILLMKKDFYQLVTKYRKIRLTA
jgi:O-antigen/teichoic acid export membrane protein